MYRILFKLLAMLGLAFFLHDRAPGGGGGDRNPVLTRLHEQRQEQVDFVDQTLARVADENRDLVDAERRNLEAARDRIRQIDEQISPLEEYEQLRSTSRGSTARYTGTGGQDGGGGERTGMGARTEPREHEYRSAGEFLADGYRAANRGDTNSADRLRTVGVEVGGNGMLRRTEDRAAEPHNTTQEVAGILPVKIVGQIMSDVDAARPFITSVGAKDLGGIPGTSFERPVVTQHVQVGRQANEKDEVANRQFIVSGVPFTKDTYGGWANVSRQSIDWTSPGVWDALMTDFVEQYAIETENAAADAFATAVVQVEESGAALATDPDLEQLLTGLYGAAKKAYQGSGRMPDTIWASLDWWVKLGVLIDHLKATTAGDGGGSSSMSSFAGNLLQTNRVIVPSFPDGTLIVGVKSRTEVYEDRFGFLSAVQPKVFGVELAYGGYMANGTVKPSAFAKFVNAA
jgi:hypothetical protein